MFLTGKCAHEQAPFWETLLNVHEEDGAGSSKGHCIWQCGLQVVFGCWDRGGDIHGNFACFPRTLFMKAKAFGFRAMGQKTVLYIWLKAKTLCFSGMCAGQKLIPLEERRNPLVPGILNCNKGEAYYSFSPDPSQVQVPSERGLRTLRNHSLQTLGLQSLRALGAHVLLHRPRAIWN